MCFSSMTKPSPTQSMPTARDGTIDANRRRQAAASGALATDTTATGPLGDTSNARTYRPTLGS